jgi:hypothetical protein
VLTGERGDAVAPGLNHDLDPLGEHGEPVAGRREAVAVGVPLVLVPAGADAHLGPPAGDDVDRRGDLREVGGLRYPMHVHIWPRRTRDVVAANAAIRVHASCVASWVGTGTVWKWS